MERADDRRSLRIHGLDFPDRQTALAVGGSRISLGSSAAPFFAGGVGPRPELLLVGRLSWVEGSAISRLHRQPRGHLRVRRRLEGLSGPARPERSLPDPR